MPKFTTICISLPEVLKKKVDKQAKRFGASRSRYVSTLIDLDPAVTPATQKRRGAK